MFEVVWVEGDEDLPGIWHASELVRILFTDQPRFDHAAKLQETIKEGAVEVWFEDCPYAVLIPLKDWETRWHDYLL